MMYYIIMSHNDNPMPEEVVLQMARYNPKNIYFNVLHKYDLHHCLISKSDVKGMPLEERRKIHDPRNLWWVEHSLHASHADICSRKGYYRLLCHRWGKESVDEFIRSFHWKSKPPVTVEWLESEGK